MGLQFTAHSVGDGAVDALLRSTKNSTEPGRCDKPVRITNSNSMSSEAIEKIAKLGVVVDIQPAWLIWTREPSLDTFAMIVFATFSRCAASFRLEPSRAGDRTICRRLGRSDQCNPYNPSLATWVTLSRRARNYEGTLHLRRSLEQQQRPFLYDQ